MRPKTITLTMATADRNGISLSQSPSGAGNLTITGYYASGGVATLDVPRHVSVYSASGDTGRTFTVYGTNRYGVSISETIVGPAAGATAKGTKNFKTVTRVAVDDATAGNVEIGTADELESQPIIVHEEIDWQVSISTGASLTYELQYTQTNLLNPDLCEDDAIWKGCGDSQNNDVSSAYQLAIPDGRIPAVRLALKAFTSGTVTFVIEPRK